MSEFNKDDPRTWGPAIFFKAVEVTGPVIYYKNKQYIGSRHGQISKITCIKGGKSTNTLNPPIFFIAGATFAFEVKVFDWIMEPPHVNT
jgi:hypothetical protein